MAAPATPPGLQAERTALAWHRTLLAAIVANAFLVLHASTQAGFAVRVLLLAYAGGSLLLFSSLLYVRRRALGHRPPATLPVWCARTLAGVVGLAGAVALVAVLAD